MTEQEFYIEKADQQLTGFAHARKGFTVETLISEMGLTKIEWQILKDKYLVLDYMSQLDIESIDHILKPSDTK